MDNSSSGMPNRPGDLSNGPSFRRGQSAAGIGGAPLLLPPGAVEAGAGISGPPSPAVVTVIVNKDDAGYGMKVSGDNPVYVQSVKEGGAAEKAGLHSGDKIIKVNGVNVMQSTHTDVVALIKSATQVVLTVQQRPRPPSLHSPAPPSTPASPHGSVPSAPSAAAAAASLLLGHPMGGGGGRTLGGAGAGGGGGHQSHGRPLLHHNSAPARTTDRITSPQPVDNERMRQLEFQKVHMVRLMLEKEQRYVDSLRSQLAAHPPPTPPASPASPAAAAADCKLQLELEGAERRVRELEERVLSLTAAANAHRVPGRELSPPPLPSRNRPASSPPTAYTALPPPLPPRPPHHHHHPPAHPPGFPPAHSPPPPPSPPEASVAEDAHRPRARPLRLQRHRATVAAVPQQVSSLHTHHRTKSSPDPLNMQNLSPAEASKRLIASESLTDLSLGGGGGGGKRSRGGGADGESPRVTPPGTPPPPYGGASAHGPSPAPTPDENADECVKLNSSNPDVSPMRSSYPHYASTTILQQYPIISMEEDEISDQEVSQMEDHGPFKSLSKLWEHTAHLAVFMNYVICNNDTSSLLFYLVTDLYKEGNAKEMRKWAYEIHSSFLVPGAPLRLNNVDENVAREIDDVLLNESDKEEILRRIFWKARVKAKEELNEQLADFQQKRTAGLGTLFGPPDSVLDSSIHDKNVELKIAEKVLLPNLDHYKEVIERDNTDIRRFTAAAALVTVLTKVFGIRTQSSNSLLDRCPTFVSKDKSLKTRLIGKSRKVNILGHHFVAHQYYSVTYCNHCQLIICGIGPQGYQCSDCSLNIHRHCVRVVEENCPGPLVKKERGNDRISKLMEKIRPEREPRRKPSSHNFSQVERMRRQTEEDSGGLTDGESGSGERASMGGRAGERRPDALREERGGGGEADARGDREAEDGLEPHAPSAHDHLSYQPSAHPPPSKPGAASINRSESYKERSYKERVQKRPLRERRKTSDPNLSSKTNDVDLENSQGLSYNTNSGSSSNSSLSTRSLEASLSRRSLDSPCQSVEAVDPGFAPSPSPATAAGAALGGGADSDLEAEADPPDWTQGVDEDTLRGLSAAEKKRQEVINELFHTERTHVRNLKVLEQVFYRPMQENGVLAPDEVQLLFANLEEMVALHAAFNASMKAKRRRDAPLVGQVAELLLSMFDGPASENFQRAAATFCARQTIALELLKERRRKDNRLNAFLTAAEGSALCRRLQLKDIIPTAMQRLTKYPLLFENLAKYTAGGSPEEVTGVQRAVERSKEILNHVNHAVREAEDQQRLADIQRRLDKAAFERAEHPIATEFKNLDLTKHRLVHEGPLTWRMGNKAQKLLDLHVLLLEEFLILLQREGERFLLKFHSHNAADRSLSPIIRVSTVLVRPNAVDNKALYLVNTSHNGAQIYDLVATSRADSKTWFRHISEAAEAYKAREGKGRRPEPAPSATPAAAADTPDAAHAATPAAAPADKPSDAEEGAGASGDGATAATEEPSGDAEVPADTCPSPPAAPGATATATATAPAASQDAAAETAAKKLGAGAGPGVGGAGAEGSPGGRRRVEPLRLLTEESPLVQPSEVVVSLRPVLTAEPVLTPIERLRRQDAAVRAALAEKQRLVADLLGVPRDDFEAIADLAGEPSPHKDPAELVLAAAAHVHQLTSAVNDCLRVTEEEAVCAGAGAAAAAAAGGRRTQRSPAVPAHALQPIAHALNSHLTQLLRTVRAQEEEREALRRECQRLREQVHTLHEARRRAAQADADADASAAGDAAQATPPAQAEEAAAVTATAATADPTQPENTGESTGVENSVDATDALASEPHEEAAADEFVDALSGECEPVSEEQTPVPLTTQEETTTDE